MLPTKYIVPARVTPKTREIAEIAARCIHACASYLSSHLSAYVSTYRAAYVTRGGQRKFHAWRRTPLQTPPLQTPTRPEGLLLRGKPSHCVSKTAWRGLSTVQKRTSRSLQIDLAYAISPRGLPGPPEPPKPLTCRIPASYVGVYVGRAGLTRLGRPLPGKAGTLRRHILQASFCLPTRVSQVSLCFFPKGIQLTGRERLMLT